MCLKNPSETGKPGGFVPCQAYIKLLSEKSRLDGRCKGLEEGTDLLKAALEQETRLLQGALTRTEKAEAEADALRQERDALVQVSAEVCPECGWAMKFPDEPCRNCEVIALRKVCEKADALVNQMLPECEACGTPCQSYALARMYQEARHAG